MSDYDITLRVQADDMEQAKNTAAYICRSTDVFALEIVEVGRGIPMSHLEREKDLRAAVEVLLVAVQSVVDAWDHGDLAEAVNDARKTADAVRTSLDE